MYYVRLLTQQGIFYLGNRRHVETEKRAARFSSFQMCIVALLNMSAQAEAIGCTGFTIEKDPSDA